MKLSDTKIRSLKPKDKNYKVFDGYGLFLLITTKGSKYWRFRYKFVGKEKLLAIGVYPHVTLAQARIKRDEAKAIIADGKDPAFEKKQEKLEYIKNSENSFEAVAREWHGKKSNTWSDKQIKKVLMGLEKNVFPYIGPMPIAEITAPELLNAIHLIEKRGAYDVAKRTLQHCSSIFTYAIGMGKAINNPAFGLSKIITPAKKQNYKHLPASELPEFLRLLDENEVNGLPYKLGLKFTILTMSRPGEVRFATWDEINLAEKTWVIPAKRMKMKRGHLIPLSRQALKILKQLKPITGEFKYIFTNRPSHPMSENTMTGVIKSLGYKGKATVHGFRHTASTILNEAGFNQDWIERQLSHLDNNAIRETYNKAKYIEGRAKMLQWYADYLDRLRKGKKVIPYKKQTV